MSPPFLKQVAAYIFDHHKDNVEKLCIVFPNKRGALFFKKYLAQYFKSAIWLPRILSIEDVISEISGLKLLEETDQVCYLYESYKQCLGGSAEPFESFIKWGQLMLRDFNEIDRFLADPGQLYDNLREIKVIENWSLGSEKLSPGQEAYLRFMGSLGQIYRHYSAFLLGSQWAYPGLAARQAAKKSGDTEFGREYHRIIFCGFNALAKAEEEILKPFYRSQKAELLWDADTYYLDDKNQEAGHFLRKNFRTFADRSPSFVASDFREPKKFRIVSAPKQMGQAQVVKQCINDWIQKGVRADEIAVVLANEKLLWPVLQQLPAEVSRVNITMEYPLRYSSVYSLLDILVQIQVNFRRQTRAEKSIYHKDFTTLLRHPLFVNWMKAGKMKTDAGEIISQLVSRNLSFITKRNINQLFGDESAIVATLLQPIENTAELNRRLTELLSTLTDFLATKNRSNQGMLELEFVFVMLKHLNRISELLTRFTHFKDIASYRQLFLQVVGNATAPFIGEPLSGLQVMGLLETRNLDFEYVVFVNANEGVLPPAKGMNSFIPYDLKKAFEMPLHTEKDAVYAHHFYRFLQRSKEVVITYDSETDSFGKGEKSRFVTQLKIELKRYNPALQWEEMVATYEELSAGSNLPVSVAKTGEALNRIIVKSLSNEHFGGLSPSGLIAFKECALRFYFRYGAGIKQTEDVEESAEANTFGSILHLSLERLYFPMLEHELAPDVLGALLPLVDGMVKTCFLEFFDNEEPVGKSLLQEEVIKVYVKKLINNDLALSKQLTLVNEAIFLKGLEQELSAPLPAIINNAPATIYVKGKIDRIDDCAGMIRVIDYKSSVKESDRFEFEGFEKLFGDKNHNKQLQLMIYAWLLYKNNYCAPEKLAPCIIPFKVFSEEPKYILGENRKPLLFSSSLLNDFEKALYGFVNTIFSGSAFEQTEDEKSCEYCAYKIICNRGGREI